MVWKLGASSSAGSAICSVSSRTSSAGGGVSRPASMASMPLWSIAGDGGGATARGGGAGGGDGGTGLRGGMAAGRGGAAAAGFAVSSSAMMRRMEARISSIDGSCAFAGWLIAEFLQTSCDAGLNPDVRGESPATPDIYSESSEVWHGNARTQSRACGYAHVPAPYRPVNGNYFPSGVRTPTQVSRT